MNTHVPLEYVCLLDTSSPTQILPQCTGQAVCEQGRHGPETSPLVRQHAH